MIFGISSRKNLAGTFIKPPRFPNLYALPYVKYRLAFAELVARAIEMEQFELLIVDLPSFLNNPKWLSTLFSKFPLVSSLIINKNPGFLVLPFVHNDSACIAAYMGQLKSIEVACVDDPNLVDFPANSIFQPNLPLKDDHFIHSDGPEDYFAKSWREMDILWTKTNPIQRSYTMLRAARVAEHLQDSLSERKKVLFVCEYQLWWAIRNQLAESAKYSKPAEATEGWKDKSAALSFEDPYLLWAKGLFDDYPCINLEFYQSIRKHEVQSFDKLRALELMLTQATSPKRGEQSNYPSIRLLLTFCQYLKTLVVSAQRATPLPVSHLFEAAESCVGSEFAKVLAERLLQYPLPELPETGVPPPTFLKISQDEMTLDGSAFPVADVLQADPYYGESISESRLPLSGESEDKRREWVNRTRPFISRQELVEMGEEEGCVRWAVKYDYNIHQKACAFIRDIVRRGGKSFIVAKSMGTLGAGIHWKATLAAKARGEDALYVKQRHRNHSWVNSLDEFTPITFLFTKEMEGSYRGAVHDSNITLRNMELKNKSFPLHLHPKPDCVYSIFKTINGSEYLWAPDVQRDHLTSISFLYTHHSMGLARYEAITKRPIRYQCRCLPWRDDELRNFPLSELGLAWSIKYASDTIIAVTFPGWKASAKLIKHARQKRVKIINVPLTVLRAGVINKLKRMNFTSTRVKKFARGEEIVSRFVH